MKYLKNRYVRHSINVLLFLGAIFATKFLVNISYPQVLLLFAIMSVYVIGINVFHAYTVLTTWIHKRRFYLFSTEMGILLMLYSSFMYYIRQDLSFENFVVSVIISLVLIVLLLGFITQRDYMNSITKTRLSLLPDEIEITSDMAFLEQNGNKKKGRLIVTTQRVCFVSNENQGNVLGIDAGSTVKKSRLFGILKIPAGFKTASQDFSIWVSYPSFWRKEITALANKKVDIQSIKAEYPA